ncbi:PadR family transcriptional regulator [Neobacillus notoginsengisoli]|uniref:PadR family transcriptional regulator n=1 Tax=Neobacillus notoginsengisoli TaxID=1578198 RepID=A0A417Z0D0_9BACI|nr:PadR family transcriptional regulator [Neobacillus notoginsengisoli]RHW43486.1 PadR family transcriptional regulator [Neobacillus notoginsengisoli]
MTLKHAILGLLSKWDATGYDIKKEFDDFMSIFWHSHLSQIYPELNKLEAEELITSKLVPQEGKPHKKVYSITNGGIDEITNWVGSPPDPPKIKDPFLMQVFFMDNISADEVIFQLKYYQGVRQKRLKEMKQTVQEAWESIKERQTMTPRLLMSSAVLRRGLEQEVQYIKWCEETIELVEACKSLWDADTSTESVLPFDEAKELVEDYFNVAVVLEEKED